MGKTHKHKHTVLSNVECANPKCAWVNGREGVMRKFIKQNVVDRCGTDGPIYCYQCSVWRNTNIRPIDSKRKKEMTAGK